MKTTTNEGFAYAVDTDSAALSAEAQAFLLGQDGKFPSWDAGFALIAKPPCFSVRTTVVGPTISTGGQSIVSWDTVDYSQGVNGAGSGMSAGASSWFQPTGDGPSWWVFGITLLFQKTAGTINTNNIVQARIGVVDNDPNSTTTGTINYCNTGNGEVTDTGGVQCIQVVTLARFRNATGARVNVTFTYRDTGASITKQYTDGSRFWGFRVGSA